MKKGMFVVLMVIAVLVFSACTNWEVREAHTRDWLSQDYGSMEIYPRVTVDYSQTLEEMISTAGYSSPGADFVADINAKNFPVSGQGKDKIFPMIIHVDMTVDSTTEILAEMEINDLRPATLSELLAFSATYPNEQRKSPIVAFGSVWIKPDFGAVVPLIWSINNENILLLSGYNGGWPKECRFLAVPK